LRLREGVPIAAVRPALDWRAVQRLEAQHLLERSGERLRATASGRLLLDAILAELVR
jgi:coproporphyrinogen III oxidase-like Fe-S oxidoreductase